MIVVTKVVVVLHDIFVFQVDIRMYHARRRVLLYDVYNFFSYKVTNTYYY